MRQVRTSLWKHIVSFASGYGSSHKEKEIGSQARGVKGMDRIIV